MLTKIKDTALSMGFSFIEGDDFDANIDADSLAYPLFVCYPATYSPENLGLLSDIGSSNDVVSYQVRVLVKGDPQNKGVDHVANYEEAKELLKLFLYRLSQQDTFAEYKAVTGQTVKNFMDSYGDGLKVNMQILWKNTTQYECYTPTS